MIVLFLVPNNAWVCLFGDTIVSLDGKRFYDTRKELKQTLESKGLTIGKRGLVKAID